MCDLPTVSLPFSAFFAIFPINARGEEACMEKIVINGSIPLKGEVNISGAKNAVVAILPAALLARDICRIENIPEISDVSTMIKILRQLGAGVKMIDRSTLEAVGQTLVQLIFSEPAE